MGGGGRDKINILKYCIGICIASTFHSSGIIYIVIPFLPKLSIKKSLVFSAIGSVIIFHLSFIEQKINYRASLYLHGFSIMWKAVTFIIMYLIFLIAGLHINYSYRNKKITNIQSDSISKILIYSFVYNILLFRNLNFHRIFRNVTPLLYAQYTEYFYRKIKFIDAFFLFLIITLMICEFFYNIENELCFFRYNYIFDLFFWQKKGALI